MNSPHKGQQHEALTVFLSATEQTVKKTIETPVTRRHSAQYDVTVMFSEHMYPQGIFEDAMCLSHLIKDHQ